MLTAGAGFDSVSTRVAKDATLDLIAKAFDAAAMASQPKMVEFTWSILDMIVELASSDQAEVFFTAYFNALCQFYSDIMNMVLSQCVVPVQMASSAWQVQTTLLWTLGASFPGLWGGAWLHVGHSDIVPKAPTASTSGGSVSGRLVPTEVALKKGITTMATDTHGEAKVDKWKVWQSWSHEKEEQREHQSSPTLSVADHESSNILELIWRDAQLIPPTMAMRVQAVIMLW